MDALAIIGERRIRESIERGELDNLPLCGKPVRIDDLSGVPEELRLGYLMLRTTGFVPEELATRKELMTIEDLIDACSDPVERRSLRRKLDAAYLRWEMLARQHGHNPARAEYARRIQTRFGADL